MDVEWWTGRFECSRCRKDVFSVFKTVDGEVVLPRHCTYCFIYLKQQQQKDGQNDLLEGKLKGGKRCELGRNARRIKWREVRE